MAEIETSTADTATAGKLCTICQVSIVAGEQVVQCPSCGLPFHDECWKENRGCSAYGCEAAPQVTKAATTGEFTSNAWNDEKNCPACSRTIKAQAVKCRFCGATFETRDVITRDAYARREYDGQQAVAARNKVIAMFLGSALGCLAPVAIIFLGLLIFKGRFWGLEFRRLPSALRALSVAGFTIGCLLILMLLSFAIFD